MRKTFDIFTDSNVQIVSAEETGSGILAVTFDNGAGGQALALINPHNTALPYTLEGQWNLIATAETAGAEVLAQESGSVTVDAVGVRIYLSDAAVS